MIHRAALWRRMKAVWAAERVGYTGTVTRPQSAQA